MPIYIYEVVKENGTPGRRYEIMQSMRDKPLSHHPETGERIRRVIAAVSTPRQRYDRAVKKISREDPSFKPPHPL